MTTRDTLLDAAAAALAEDGLAGVSARSVAGRAGVNQALVFYHFGSVSGMLDAAVRRSVDLAVVSYRDRLADVATLGELLSLGRDLHAAEKSLGNVLQMAQVMAGAMRDETLAEAARYAMDRWTGEVETALRRVLRPTPLDGIVDPRGLARAVSAGFLGLELHDAVDTQAGEDALRALEAVGALVSALDVLPPLAVRALRGRARRALSRADSRRGGGA